MEGRSFARSWTRRPTGCNVDTDDECGAIKPNISRGLTRQRVSRDYTDAQSASSGTGCCSAATLVLVVGFLANHSAPAPSLQRLACVAISSRIIITMHLRGRAYCVVFHASAHAPRDVSWFAGWVGTSSTTLLRLFRTQDFSKSSAGDPQACRPHILRVSFRCRTRHLLCNRTWSFKNLSSLIGRPVGAQEIGFVFLDSDCGTMLYIEYIFHAPALARCRLDRREDTYRLRPSERRKSDRSSPPTLVRCSLESKLVGVVVS